MVLLKQQAHVERRRFRSVSQNRFDDVIVTVNFPLKESDARRTLLAARPALAALALLAAITSLARKRERLPSIPRNVARVIHLGDPTCAIVRNDIHGPVYFSVAMRSADPERRRITTRCGKA